MEASISFLLKEGNYGYPGDTMERCENNSFHENV